MLPVGDQLLVTVETGAVSLMPTVFQTSDAGQATSAKFGRQSHPILAATEAKDEMWRGKPEEEAKLFPFARQERWGVCRESRSAAR